MEIRADIHLGDAANILQSLNDNSVDLIITSPPYANQRKSTYGGVYHKDYECNNTNHSAAFPEELPEWFIKLFTREYDVVLDPFAGAGTTLTVAKRLKRNSIGIEIKSEYFELMEKKLNPVELVLFEPDVIYGRTKTK